MLTLAINLLAVKGFVDHKDSEVYHHIIDDDDGDGDDDGDTWILIERTYPFYAEYPRLYTKSLTF